MQGFPSTTGTQNQKSPTREMNPPLDIFHDGFSGSKDYSFVCVSRGHGGMRVWFTLIHIFFPIFSSTSFLGYGLLIFFSSLLGHLHVCVLSYEFLFLDGFLAIFVTFYGAIKLRRRTRRRVRNFGESYATH